MSPAVSVSSEQVFFQEDKCRLLNRLAFLHIPQDPGARKAMLDLMLSPFEAEKPYDRRMRRIF